MSDHVDHLEIAWWANNLDELDREIARLGLMCKARLLDAGVIERVLRKDTSVCGTENPIAFAKLHDLVMMHYAIRKRAADALGQAQTAQIEAHIIERLRKVVGDQLDDRPGA